jgi:hypothetical protein
MTLQPNSSGSFRSQERGLQTRIDEVADRERVRQSNVNEATIREIDLQTRVE